MANPSKKKGTGGETELLRLLDIDGLVRTPPASLWDLQRTYVEPAEWGAYDQMDVTPIPDPPLQVLATRPDRGEWLMTMDLPTFKALWERAYWTGDLRIESKRYARFSLHTIFGKKFRSLGRLK